MYDLCVSGTITTASIAPGVGQFLTAEFGQDDFGEGTSVCRRTKVLLLFTAGLVLVMSDHILAGVTVDYSTAAETLIEINPYGQQYDLDEQVNQSASASVNGNVAYVGGLSMWGSAGRILDANDVLGLFCELGGDYWLDDDLWILANYFAQDGYSGVWGNWHFPEHPAGTGLFLRVEVTLPIQQWDGDWQWQFWAHSGLDVWYCGQVDSYVFGSLAGVLRARANQPVAFVLEQVGNGYAESPLNDLGEGTTRIEARMSVATRLIGDLDVDGTVALSDFSQLSRYWDSENCQEPNHPWCGGADFDRNNDVDIADLAQWSETWLESITIPDPNTF